MRAIGRWGRKAAPPGTRRRRWMLGLSVVAVAAAAALIVVPAFATLSGGTTFEGNDGNLIAQGGTDWSSFVDASGSPSGSTVLHAGIDNTSGTSDNSFGQGTKEDNPAVSVVTGSIPPNKSDLTRFYEASQLINNNVYLYLGWERSNVLGSANMDFEINQNNPVTSTSCPGPNKGSCTINRTNGDILVTYDFTNGGSRPMIGIMRWLTVGGTNPYDATKTNANGDCFSANTLPCWGDQKTIGTDNSEGNVNGASVTDPIEPLSPNACPAGTPLPSCPAGTFGEASINLTGAGVVTSTNACNFGSATTFLKSRSSSSFTAEVKDFIAPVATPLVSQCGTVQVIKHTQNSAGTRSGVDQAFSYSSTGLLDNSSAGGTCSGISSGNFCLNDKDGSDTVTANNVTSPDPNNTVTDTGVNQGAKTITETVPSGYQLNGVVCHDVTSNTDVASGTNAEADFTLQTGHTVVCTYTNQQLPGAIQVTKVSLKDSSVKLAGATFSVTDSTGQSVGTITTGDGKNGTTQGVGCLGGLPLGSYTVTETGAPSNYGNGDAAGTSVPVTQSGTCGSGQEATTTITDPPLTDIAASATSEDSGPGGTQSRIVCKDASNAVVGQSAGTGNTNPASASATGLLPGTYTCTVVIDP